LLESVIFLTSSIQSNLSIRLKISVKADHRYFAEGDEKALRRGSCTPGTRVVIIELIIQWAFDTSPGSVFVYWLSGQGGAGKTTIAYTICQQLDAVVSRGNSRVVLGGSFFCSRQFPETRSASAIIRTVVYQLALRSPSFRMALNEHGRFETVDYGPRSQLMGLLIEPWQKSALARLAANEPCYVVPIDALDELERKGGAQFLGTLFDVLEKEVLSGLKFFVTSRSDPGLVKQITSFPDKQVCRLEEVPLLESSADIKLYLEDNLADCATVEQIQQLVLDSAGLFIYAATVVEYVSEREVEEQKGLLKRLLSPSPSPSSRRTRGATAALDQLYLQMLETSLVDPRDKDDPDAFQDCLSILHTFICTVERTSTAVAVAILNASVGKPDAEVDVGMAEGVLNRLHAVLYRQGGKVMSFHKSFSDSLFDKSRSQRFFCDQGQHHLLIAKGCFAIMNEQLRFNIADIPSSHHLDCENPTLAASIEANILPPLRYASVDWGAHFAVISHDRAEALAEHLAYFVQLRILFWMEAMNLLGQRGRCHGILRTAQRWLLKAKVGSFAVKIDLQSYISPRAKQNWFVRCLMQQCLQPTTVQAKLHCPRPTSIFPPSPHSLNRLPSFRTGGSISVVSPTSPAQKA
jgi:NACHT domain